MKGIREGDKFPCWRIAGWNEMMSWFRLAKQRKKRKKREKFEHKEVYENSMRYTHNALNPLPRIMFKLSLVLPILPLLLLSSSLNIDKNSVKLVHGQLIVDHPRSRIHTSSRDPLKMLNLLIPTLEPTNLTAINDANSAGVRRRTDYSDEHPLLHPWKLKEFHESESIANYSTLPTSKDKQNELLRKLSSTMLLETLLRHPFPTNKLLLPLPNLVREPPYNLNLDNRDYRPTRKLGPTSIKNGARQRDTRKEPTLQQRIQNLDHTSSILSKNRTLGDFSAGQDLFNASSLNYLVEKLLSSKAPEQDITRKPKRPMNREFSKSTDRQPTSYPILPNHLRNLKNTHLTLDMLIKDEYDSRVKPMFKSLLDQQRISTSSEQSPSSIKNHTTSTVPVNHKLVNIPPQAAELTSTTQSPLEDRIEQGASPTILVTSPTINSRDQILTLEQDEPDTLIAFENFDDNDDSEDDDDNELNKQNSSTIENKKITIKNTLQIVPPYQFSSEFGYDPNRPKPPKLYNPDTQTTTSTTISPKLKANEERRLNLAKSGEKAADASTRGTLVFSDGAIEAQRINKKRAQSKMAANRENNESQIKRKEASPSTGSEQHNPLSDSSLSERIRESFLLSQLFSTVNPLTELDLRLKEQLNNRDSSMRNPLVYKGYVGRDENILPPNGGDWSRPINNDEIRSTVLRRPNIKSDFLGSPAPPTEPPTTPYNFFLHQPVTNAQAVPSMVIPTSDPPQLTTTTPSPPKYSIQYPKNEGTFLYNNSTFRYPQKIDDRRYSYQLPDRPPNRNQTQFSPQSTPTSEASDPKTTANRTSDKVSPNDPVSNIRTQNELDQLWSPSKINSNESSVPNIQKRKQISLNHEAPSSVTNVSMNFSSPITVPYIGANTIGNRGNQANYSHTDSLPNPNDNDSDSDSDSPSGFTTTKAPRQRLLTNDINGRRGSGHDSNQIQREFSQGENKTNFQRNKSKIYPLSREHANSTINNGLLGDTDSEQETQNVRKIKLASNGTYHNRQNNTRSSESDSPDDYDQYEGDEQSDDEAAEQRRRKIMSKRIKEQVRSNGEHQGTKFKHGNKFLLFPNNTHKNSNTESHEQAGSEIQLTGLPDGRKRNMTTSLRIPTNSMDRGEQESYSSTSATNLGSPPISFSSTIIPNTNFYGEASSESPTLDNPISIANQGSMGKSIKHISSSTTEEPFPRNLNNVISTSTTLTPTTSTRAVQTSTQLISTAKQDDASVTGSGGTSKSAPAKSNDRLAFILIGGSCALSVLCLVMAAMSMRCQDMCDDYRSLRNAERAALKLQKHRLKYTKNHQINRFNHGQASANIEHNLISSELNNLQQGNSSLEPEINLMRNSKCLNGKSIQFNDHPFNASNHDPDINGWNMNCQIPLSAYITKEPRACRCGNCVGHHWMCQDDMVGNKHISWLHPHYYLQQQAPLRPLFGAGSSVGTFFPRRVEDQGFVAGGSVGAQTLIDSQPSHSCAMAAVDQRSAMKSKSILQQSKRMCSKPTIGFDACELPNFGCNNPEHDHSHHICHNHHRYNMETSASDESKLTLDESANCAHCDSTKCSGNHQNLGLSNRLKLAQLRSNAHNNHTSTGWKAGSIRKGSSNHHNHHQHRHHQPVVSSSDTSSIAQCTCSHDNQPLLAKSSRVQNRTSHKPLHKYDQRVSSSQQARRDKAMLIWSTNRDRLI